VKAAATTSLVILMSTGAFAAAPGTEKPSAGQFITGVIYEGMAVFQDPQLSPAQRDRRFGQLIRQNFDVERIARFTLGRHWTRATEKERRDFAEVLPDYFAQAFAGRIGQFAGAVVQVVRTSRVNDNAHVVTRIYFPGLRPSAASTNEIEVGWLIGETAAGYRIEDLDLEGTSLELTERADVASLIERTGATITGAVNDMRAKTGQTVAGP